MNKSNQSVYEESDHMPEPVATEMLSAPKAKLSNRMRKVCRAARERRIISPKTEPISAEVTLTRKCRAATFDQLCKWNRRAIARRAAVQRAFVLLQRRDPEGKRLALRVNLSERAAAFELLTDATYGELKRRTEK
jgi:hypothetical protein